jgi:hypothetical protein
MPHNIKKITLSLRLNKITTTDLDVVTNRAHF